MVVTHLASVCKELVERWDDLAGYFGGQRQQVSVELRSVPSLEVHIFDDRLSRPQFAILSWLLTTSKYMLLYTYFVLCSSACCCGG